MTKKVICSNDRGQAMKRRFGNLFTIFSKSLEGPNMSSLSGKRLGLFISTSTVDHLYVHPYDKAFSTLLRLLHPLKSQISP